MKRRGKELRNTEGNEIKAVCRHHLRLSPEKVLKLVANKMRIDGIDEDEQTGCGTLTAIIQSQIFPLCHSFTNVAVGEFQHLIQSLQTNLKVPGLTMTPKHELTLEFLLSTRVPHPENTDSLGSRIFASHLITNLLDRFGVVTVSLEARIYHEFCLWKVKEGSYWLMDSFCRSRKPGFWKIANSSKKALRFAREMWTVFLGNGQKEQQFYLDWFAETIDPNAIRFSLFKNRFITLSVPSCPHILDCDDDSWHSLSNPDLRDRSHRLFERYFNL